jgi:single-strand DNA-binding protein
MANDLNQVRIDGRLVEAPNVKPLDSGARVATMRLANNRYFKGRDDPEWKERKGYFDVQAWNALADAVAGLSKGQPVHIEGALGQDQWTDTEGKQHTRILIEASKVEVRVLKRERAEARDQEAGVEL